MNTITAFASTTFRIIDSFDICGTFSDGSFGHATISLARKVSDWGRESKRHYLIASIDDQNHGDVCRVSLRDWDKLKNAGGTDTDEHPLEKVYRMIPALEDGVTMHW